MKVLACCKKVCCTRIASWKWVSDFHNSGIREEKEKMLKAECFSVPSLLKHLYKASLGNMGPYSLGLKYCERLGIPGKCSLTHLLLLTTLVLIYPGHTPQILLELSKAKKGHFSHAQIQTVFVNRPDKQKKLLKTQATKKLWRTVETSSPWITSKVAALGRAYLLYKPKSYLIITQKVRIWKGNISAQTYMDATSGTQLSLFHLKPWSKAFVEHSTPITASKKKRLRSITENERYKFRWLKEKNRGVHEAFFQTKSKSWKNSVHVLQNQKKNMALL